ncbi:MAG: amino acid adenylation domain-containing protein, partial [Clostridia bacterium]|nr:amino acid adenylation domain-containing protein [Clostridia bacterium]
MKKNQTAEQTGNHGILYPLSRTQLGILAESLSAPGTTIYNIPCLVKLDDSVDPARLRSALQEAIISHPYLSMTIAYDEKGEPMALRSPDNIIGVDLLDHLPGPDALVYPFDLSEGQKLCRAAVIDSPDGKYLFLDMHHIVSDDRSVQILLEDMNTVYDGGEITRETYGGFEFALDEQKQRGSDQLAAARKWYERACAGSDSQTLPAAEANREGKDQTASARCVGTCSAGRIKAWCDSAGVKPDAFFTTAFGIALKAYTGSESAVFATIYPGRKDPRLSRSVSMFVKTLPVIFDAAPEQDIQGAVASMGGWLSDAAANDIFSFAEIHDAWGIGSDVLFAYQGETAGCERIGKAPAEKVEISPSRAVAPFGVYVSIVNDQVEYRTEWDPALYSRYTMDGFIRMLDQIVLGMTGKETVGEIELVNDEDRQVILSLHDTAFPVAERPAYRLLQDSAEKYPDRTALIAADRSLTYRELNAEANAVGHILREHGAGPETIVGVMADRDSYAYVMRQGALKSGGAFMPIDPEYPEERIRYILDTSGAKLLLTTSSVMERRKELLSALQSEGICVIDAGAAAAGGCRDNLNADVPGDALAYVIFTSGSTGKPKGAMLTNHNLVSFCADTEISVYVKGYNHIGSVSLAIAALTFDFSVMEEFVPLSAGLTVVLADQSRIMDAEKLAELILDHHVDVVSGTPSYYTNLLDIPAFIPALKSLKSIHIGAEQFPQSLYRRLTDINPGLFIMNGYGPTEATMITLMKHVQSPDITLGLPIVNVKVATLDREQRLQPPGAMGELVIMGDGVGRGYIGRDDLTRRSFIRLLGMPAYRSGDLVRIRQDGQIEFHGRIDDQVKLRGLRIELGEVQSVIASYPAVRSNVVIVVHGETDYLAAYFTADEQVDIADLRAHISRYLTAYMVPQAFMQLDAMPMNANGKVDKKALPAIEITEDEIIPARNRMQQEILDIAGEVIGTGRIGITTDLYMAGLSSIGCIKLCSVLSERFDVNVNVSEIYQSKTAEGIESLILSKSGEKAVSYELRESYPLSQTQMGIYVDSELYAGTTVYNIPFLYHLDSGVDLPRLRDALIRTFLSHPYLFMTLRDENGEIKAVRNQPEAVEIEISDHLPEMAELVRPYDLTSGERLFRAALFDTENGKYLFVDMHHIVSDGSSFSIFLEDLNSAYDGADVPVETYTGYEAALDEAYRLTTDKPQTAKAWYDSIFLGCGGETLPVRDAGPTDSQVVHQTFIGEISADPVRAYCLENGLSLNAFFTAAFGMALQAYTGSDHAVFSTIYNGRSDSRMARSISMFVKTLPVWFESDQDSTVRDMVQKYQHQLLTAMANDIYSFAEIRKAYGIGADVLFAYQGETSDEVMIGRHPAGKVELPLSHTIAPFGVDIWLNGDRIVYRTERDPSRYSGYTMNGFVSMLDQIVSDMTVQETVREIELVSEAGREAILSLHDTDAAVAERPAYRLLQDSAEKYPDRIALIAVDRTLTYRELNEEANAVGHTLREHGAGPETIVGVMADRDSYADVMREGVLRSGGAFMPIDPEYPEERIRFILEDSGSRLLITTGRVMERRKDLIAALRAEGITVIDAMEAVSSGSRENVNAEVPFEALAYVIYTSGSTGKPKGVMLTNRNLVSYADDNPRNYETLTYTEKATVSVAMAAFTFDVSITEEFVPFAHGMTNVLSTREQMMDAAQMCDLMVRNHVDVINGTPSYFMNMIEIDAFAPAIRGLKAIDVGAEAFPPVLFDRLKAINPDLYIVNTYGPTETTVSCTLKEVTSADDVTIGGPLANVTMATMDRNGKLQPLGALGELVIMGDGVGRGYIGREDLNKKNFITLLGKRAYRSGDLVRIREDGDIEFHGRMDDQVKLRGLRVELGEIQNVIASYPSFRASVV